MASVSTCFASNVFRRRGLVAARCISSLSPAAAGPPVVPSTRLLDVSSATAAPSSPARLRARHAHTVAIAAAAAGASAGSSHHQRIRSPLRRWRAPGAVRWMSDNPGQFPDFIPSVDDTLHDLKTFLTKVGTDSKEARYWLKHFQESSALEASPFAVVFVPAILLRDTHSVNALASTLAFLQRNNMRIILVHGIRPSKLMHELQVHKSMISQDINFASTPWAKLRAAQNLLDSNSTLLMDSLAKHHCFSQLVPSTSIFYVDSTYQDADHSQVVSDTMCHVDSNLLSWSLKSGYIPIVSGIAQSADGRVVHLEPFDAVASLVRTLQPRKVILLNHAGALVNMTTGHKVSEVNCPSDNAALLGQPWCVGRLRQKLQRILSMLDSLPEHGSVVLTSPKTILRELFTHHGDGTIFQQRDRVVVHSNLDGVDIARLRNLLCRSFEAELTPDYFDKLKSKLTRLYLSESYSFAAIITNEEGSEGVPYLDKFIVAGKSQGQGSSQALWDLLRRDYPALFWRSYTANRFNQWYYPRCCGLQSVSKWKVFWYGFNDYQLSQKLVQVAAALPESFLVTRPDVKEELDMSRPSSWQSDPMSPNPALSRDKPSQQNENLMKLALEGI